MGWMIKEVGFNSIGGTLAFLLQTQPDQAWDPLSFLSVGYSGHLYQNKGTGAKGWQLSSN